MATTDMIRMLEIVAGGGRRAFSTAPLYRDRQCHQPADRRPAPDSRGSRSFPNPGFPVVVGPQAMAGTTAPVTLSALLVQHNAENLALVALSQMVRPGAPVFMGSASTVSDMGTGAIAVGAPETGVITAASAALARFYGVPSRGNRRDDRRQGPLGPVLCRADGLDPHGGAWAASRFRSPPAR